MAELGNGIVFHHLTCVCRINTLPALDIPTQYQPITSEEFQQHLIGSGMTSVLALDFTEQLLVFEDFGNVYAQHGFIQAVDVSVCLKWRFHKHVK